MDPGKTLLHRSHMTALSQLRSSYLSISPASSPATLGSGPNSPPNSFEVFQIQFFLKIKSLKKKKLPSCPHFHDSNHTVVHSLAVVHFQPTWAQVICGWNLSNHSVPGGSPPCLPAYPSVAWLWLPPSIITSSLPSSSHCKKCYFISWDLI